MRITFVLAEADLGGGCRVIATYARLLAARGHVVTVVATPQRGPGLKSGVKMMLRGEPRPWARRVGPSHFDRLAERGVRYRVLDRFRPVTDSDLPEADAVFATWWETVPWVAALSTSKGAKGFFIQHYEAHMDHQPADRVDAAWRLPLRKVAIGARWLAELARDRFGDADVPVIPDSVDHDLFHAPPRSKRARPTVGVMYSTVRFKACEVALEAFRLAQRRVPHLRLIAFGSMLPTPELPLPDGVEFHHRPAQDSLRDLYAACDAWLFASRSEGFGLPLLEAMACRTPVIATPAGAAPELVERGGGVLVPFDDPGAMADAIERIAGMDDASWRELSASAHATANGWSWNDAVDRFESIVTQMAALPAGASAC